MILLYLLIIHHKCACFIIALQISESLAMDGHAAQKVKAYALIEFIIVILTKIYCQTNSIVNNKHVALNESVLNYICCFKSSPASSVEISD